MTEEALIKAASWDDTPSRHLGMLLARISVFETVASCMFQVAVCQEGEEGNFKPCLIEDEGGPLEAAIQVEASNRRKLLW